jgi:hypothetical protein
MSRQAVGAFYGFVLILIVVTVDLLFFRHHFWGRLAVNVGIVLVFTAFYFRFVRRT